MDSIGSLSVLGSLCLILYSASISVPLLYCGFIIIALTSLLIKSCLLPEDKVVIGGND